MLKWLSQVMQWHWVIEPNLLSSQHSSIWEECCTNKFYYIFKDHKNQLKPWYVLNGVGIDLYSYKSTYVSFTHGQFLLVHHLPNKFGGFISDLWLKKISIYQYDFCAMHCWKKSINDPKFFCLLTAVMLLVMGLLWLTKAFQH